MRLDYDFVVRVFVNLNDIIDNVRQLNARSVDFYSTLLAEINFDVGHLEGDSFGPTRMLRLACIVRHTNRESVIDAIRC